MKSFVERMTDLGFGEKAVRSAFNAASRAVQMNDELQEEVRSCVQCDLSQQCSGPVPGGPSTKANIMLIGEAPGEEEDNGDVPFIGDSGRLLNLMLGNLNLNRRDLYITNAIKCRPPHNRTPHRSELEACHDHLRNEIKWIRPSVIITLGNPAMWTLRKDYDLKITRERGKIAKQSFAKNVSIPVMHTFHPSYLLHKEDNPASFKRAYDLMYNDIRQAISEGES